MGRLSFLAVLTAMLLVAVPARAAEFPDGVEAGALTEPGLLAANCERIKEDSGRTTVIGAVMSRIVQSPGVFDFSGLDGQVDTAIGCGLDPAIRVFAQPTSSEDRGMPDDLDAYGRFFGALVGHLKGRVNRFGVENEVIAPNHWTDSPADYFQLVKVAADAAHQANPGAIVLDSVSSSGGFSIIEARKQWQAGDLDRALATIQESQNNDLGGGPYLTSTSQLSAYLSNPKVLKMQDFYDQLVAHKDLIDALQLHYYGPASSLPSVIAMVRADGLNMPIEIWELGHRYLDGRPFDQTGQADESTRLLATSIGEGARYVVLQQYFDKPGNEMYGLIDGDGNSRESRFAVRNTFSMLRGTRSARRLRAGAGTDGYRFTRPGGWRWALWTDGNRVRPNRHLGVRSTTVAVTGNQGGTKHLPVSAVVLDASPRWIEPDMLVFSRKKSRRHGTVRIRAHCPTASPTRFCRGWIKVRGGKGKRTVIAARKYRLGRGVSRSIELRRHRFHGRKVRAKAIYAVPFSCPGKLKKCRSWQNLPG
jgi:hypothetical protein